MDYDVGSSSIGSAVSGIGGIGTGWVWYGSGMWPSVATGQCSGTTQRYCGLPRQPAHYTRHRAYIHTRLQRPSAFVCFNYLLFANIHPLKSRAETTIYLQDHPVPWTVVVDV